MSAAVQARRAEIARRFPSDARIAEVAAEMGVSYMMARNDLIAIGRRVGRSGRKKGDLNYGSREKYSAILRAVQGEPRRTLQSFADQFGVTKERIRQIVRMVGLPKPHAERPHPKADARKAEKAARKALREAKRNERLAQMVALHERGMTQKQIAYEMGIWPSNVSEGLKQARALGITVSA